MDAAQQKIDEGYALRKAGDESGALRCYRDAVTELRGMDAPSRLAHAVRHVADLQRKAGDLDLAQPNYAEALAIYRADSATGTLDLANTLRGDALLMEAKGDAHAARAMWLEACELYASVGVQAGVDEATRRVHALDPLIA